MLLGVGKGVLFRLETRANFMRRGWAIIGVDEYILSNVQGKADKENDEGACYAVTAWLSCVLQSTHTRTHTHRMALHSFAS